MKHQTLSIVVATYNEENNIVDCLDSIKSIANEIVVVDGKSLDRTADLVKKFNSKLYSVENHPMFHKNKNLGIQKATQQWILLLDADERVTDDLAKEIQKVINSNNNFKGYYVNRKNWFLGSFLTKGGAYPDPVIRLFKKTYGYLPEKSVHEQVKINGQVGNLKNDLIHLADPTFERYLQRFDRYTTLTAQYIKSKNPGRNTIIALYYICLKPMFTFIDIYIKHKGFKDGFRGFIWAYFSAAHHFFAYIKYWQMK